jgi:hemerythrin-like metal-binding protein
MSRLQRMPVTCTWSPVLSVGIPALDSDHRCLVRVVSLLHGMEHAAEACSIIATTLDTLTTYATFHFRREERVMAYLDFPGFEVHCREHAGFLSYVHEQRKKLVRNSNLVTAEKLLSELGSWLTHHILIQDKAYVPHIDDVRQLDLVAREGTAVCLLDLTGSQPAHSFRRKATRRMVAQSVPLRTAVSAS